MTVPVRNTAELRRILALPRRRADGSDLVEPLTSLLQMPGGTMRLRPAQALALHDIGVHGGAVLPLGVGEGKTLIALLAAYVLDAQRPLLLLPANLIEKTERDRRSLAKHWRIPDHVRLLSYQMLGRVQAAAELEVYKPDALIGDEAHALKNRKAAVTRRVGRFIAEHPETRCVWMSGTIISRSVNEAGHLLRWALRDGAPVPKTVEELEEWALALDEKVEDWQRNDPGALLELCSSDERADIRIGRLDELTAARRGFQRRLVETPGVVATTNDGEHVGASIYIRPITYEMAPATVKHFDVLRNDMMTPDGWDVTPVDVWRHARELALGMHYIWDPRPPDEWRAARKAWFAFVRAVLSRSRTLDSPEHVAMACDAGRLPSDELNSWRRIKDTFIPNVVPVWHDDTALKVCAEWMRGGDGIVWTAHSFFANRLAELTGAPYFGEGGLDSSGAFIDDAKGVVIASIAANKEGRNLQRWSRNLVTTPPDGAGDWQQLIGRTHRPGQIADVVTFDVLLGCAEHARAMQKAKAAAEAVRDTTGAPAKLLIADFFDWPDEHPQDARWAA